MATDLTLRPYIRGEDGDLPLLRSWSAGHGRDVFNEALIPPDAIIVEQDGFPVAFGALYLTLGVGISQIDHLYTKPDLGLRVARRAFTFLFEYFKIAARDMGYGVITAVCDGGMQREVENLGQFERVKSNQAVLAISTAR